ncbi:Uncharacterised protein [uncultured archaeon]|nr:Uncharacterised protein [uncultured archaeon]
MGIALQEGMTKMTEKPVRFRMAYASQAFWIFIGVTLIIGGGFIYTLLTDARFESNSTQSILIVAILMLLAFAAEYLLISTKNFYYELSETGITASGIVMYFCGRALVQFYDLGINLERSEAAWYFAAPVRYEWIKLARYSEQWGLKMKSTYGSEGNVFHIYLFVTAPQRGKMVELSGAAQRGGKNFELHVYLAPEDPEGFLNAIRAKIRS